MTTEYKKPELIVKLPSNWGADKREKFQKYRYLVKDVLWAKFKRIIEIDKLEEQAEYWVGLEIGLVRAVEIYKGAYISKKNGKPIDFKTFASRIIAYKIFCFCRATFFKDLDSKDKTKLNDFIEEQLKEIDPEGKLDTREVKSNLYDAIEQEMGEYESRLRELVEPMGELNKTQKEKIMSDVITTMSSRQQDIFDERYEKGLDWATICRNNNNIAEQTARAEYNRVIIAILNRWRLFALITNEEYLERIARYKVKV